MKLIAGRPGLEKSENRVQDAKDNIAEENNEGKRLP